MTKKSFDWDHYITLPSCGSLIQLAQRSFAVNLNFVDHRGWLQGIPAGRFFNPANRLSALISASDEGFRSKRDTAFQLASEVSAIRLPKRSTTSLGTSLAGVPIVVNDKYHGYVYTDDFFAEDGLAEQKSRFESYLRRCFPDVPDIVEQIDNIPILNGAEIEYLLDIMDLIAENFTSEVLSKSKKKTNVNPDSMISIKDFKNNHIVGKSDQVRELLLLLSRIASSDATVLITGESGVGKELVAKTLHENSSRHKGAFLGLNCGAFNEGLLESELFGHVKGAFTGADTNKDGHFAQANGGTLFLDEIGESSLSTQVKMLRFLQESTFMPMGSSKELSSNARIITATNRDLKQMLKKGKFRQDFYYRVKVIQISVPSLRERKDDIPLLIEHFLKKNCEHPDKVKIDEKAIQMLMDYHWPGNIRQLENEVKRLTILCEDDGQISDKQISPEIVEAAQKSKQLFKIDDRLKKSIEDREKQMIIDGLKKHEGNKTKLARALGMSKSVLTNRIKKYGIKES